MTITTHDPVFKLPSARRAVVITPPEARIELTKALSVRRNDDRLFVVIAGKGMLTEAVGFGQHGTPTLLTTSFVIDRHTLGLINGVCETTLPADVDDWNTLVGLRTDVHDIIQMDRERFFTGCELATDIQIVVPFFFEMNEYIGDPDGGDALRNHPSVYLRWIVTFNPVTCQWFRFQMPIRRAYEAALHATSRQATGSQRAEEFTMFFPPEPRYLLLHFTGESLLVTDKFDPQYTKFNTGDGSWRKLK